MPIGIIVPWSTQAAGAVPAGFAICDGRTVVRSDGGGNITTPNLMGRFILADPISGTTGGGAATTSTSGSHSHGGVTGDTAISIAQMPSHTHPYSVNTTGGGSPGGGAKQTDYTTGNTGSTGGGAGHNHGIAADGNHTHTLTVVPAYFTLIYLMRI